MSEEALRDIAAEPQDVEEKRASLKQELETLREGLRICQRYKPLKPTGLSPYSFQSLSSIGRIDFPGLLLTLISGKCFLML
jgi:hypothetical protein